MKRKHPKPDTVVPPEVLEQVKEPFSADHLKKQSVKCSVCGADAPAGQSEPLCWVCRRLKISAWHEIEQQMPAQE